MNMSMRDVSSKVLSHACLIIDAGMAGWLLAKFASTSSLSIK